MRLTKHARTKIRKAKGPVEIQWPVSAGIPVEGNEYNAGHELRIVVIARRETEKRWKTVVRENHDPFRTLRIKATQEPDPETGILRTETEPEPVDKATQDRYSTEGAVKTALMGSEQRMRANIEDKEAGGGSQRSERAKLRHIRSLERNLSEDA